MRDEAPIAVAKTIDWHYIFWHLRYTLNELAHSALAGILLAITLFLSFLLHDSDIARIGQGLLRGEGVFCGAYLAVSLAYCMTIADPLFKKSSLREFIDSLPINLSTGVLSRLFIALAAQAPLLYLGFLVLSAAIGFTQFLPLLLLLLCLVNLGILAVAKCLYNSSVHVAKSLDLSPRLVHFVHFDWSYLVGLHLALFLHNYWSNYLRDIVLLVMLLGFFYGLDWQRDPEAVNFMFFVFSCFFISQSRYLNLLKELENDEIAAYWHTLPLSLFERTLYQAGAAFLIILPFIAAYYFWFSRSLLRSGLLVFMLGWFLCSRWLMPKYSSYLNIVVAIAVFLFIRYRL